MPAKTPPVLEVEHLSIGFESDSGLVSVVEDIPFSLNSGETLALVGESGCGKSLTALAMLQLLPAFGKILGGSIKLHGQELVGLDNSRMQAIRGNQISMIFQEPMSALNPVFTIGQQVAEPLILHKNLTKEQA